MLAVAFDSGNFLQGTKIQFIGSINYNQYTGRIEWISRRLDACAIVPYVAQLQNGSELRGREAVFNVFPRECVPYKDVMPSARLRGK
jgi:hypothetical protein